MTSVDRRRELNRLAAQKLRNRQKEKAVTVKQDYFAAQSRNTQLLYDVKQLRKYKAELARQYEAHLPVCRHAQDPPQSADLPESQTMLSGAVPQYAMYTSGNQQFISPVLLLSSDGISTLPSAPVQLVTIAPSDNNFTEYMDTNLTNSNIKQESDNRTSESRMSNSNAASDGDEKDKTLNGVCEPTSITGNGVSEALLTAVDEHTNNCKATVNNSLNSVSDGASSVPASPITKPKNITRRRCSMSSVTRRTSEPALKAPKRSSARHMSSDEPLVKKVARENSDNLPLFLSAMTDE